MEMRPESATKKNLGISLEYFGGPMPSSSTNNWRMTRMCLQIHWTFCCWQVSQVS
jgi:hypothetical protein